jgi:multisubunit Na+/H+ antiporter MnhC subunit
MPAMIWIALSILTVFSLFAIGYLVGRIEKTNWYMILALSLDFSAVILVIIDLDSERGTIQINHQPMINLYQRLLGG